MFVLDMECGLDWILFRKSSLDFTDREREIYMKFCGVDFWLKDTKELLRLGMPRKCVRNLHGYMNSEIGKRTDWNNMDSKERKKIYNEKYKERDAYIYGGHQPSASQKKRWLKEWREQSHELAPSDERMALLYEKYGGEEELNRLIKEMRGQIKYARIRW